MDTNLNKIVKKRYEIKEKISFGGMSSIYLASDLITQKTVVLKILRKNLFNDEKTKLLFLNEIKITSQLKHPNIVRMDDYFLFDGYWCLVLEYIRGINLRKFLQDKSALSEKEAINLILQILDVLSFTEKHKIVHRDIKPENILLIKEKKVKILDFGVSVDKHFNSDVFKTKIIGSLKYISPELIANQEATIQSDLYSAGIVFFEMLSGKPPFVSNKSLTLIRHHLYTPMPRITFYQTKINQQLENIIIKATAKNPRERYQNAQEMINALQNYLQNPPKNVSPLFLENSTYQGTIANPLFLQDLKSKDNFFWLNKKILFAIILFQVLILTIALFKLLIDNWSLF